jgi:hypothetical protein
MPCGSYNDRRFGGTYSLKSDDGGNTILWIVSSYKNHSTSHSRRRHSSGMCLAPRRSWKEAKIKVDFPCWNANPFSLLVRPFAWPLCWLTCPVCGSYYTVEAIIIPFTFRDKNGHSFYGAEHYMKRHQLRSHSSPIISWNPKFLYRVHMSSPPVPILSQINPDHTTPSYLYKINLSIV